MKTLIYLLICLLLVISCSNEDKAGSKWKVSGEEEYNEVIDNKIVYKSLAEFEKILLAPAFYYEKQSGITGFKNEISINAEATPAETEDLNQIELSETSSMNSDGKGNFHLTYSNNHHEGWDLIWKDQFLYQKMIGGEYNRYVSMGKHSFTKENLFKMIPEIYSAIRNNGSIKTVSDTTMNGRNVKKLTIVFTDKKSELPPLKPRKYLQNSFGVQAMENDNLINTLMNKKKSAVTGKLDVYLTPSMTPVKLDLDTSFTLSEGNVSFRIKGTRNLTTNKTSIETPSFRPEYHRRKVDATINIMEENNTK